MAKNTLDGIIGHYRREESGQASAQWAAPGRHLEIEARLQSVDAVNFNSIYSALLGRRASDGRELTAVGAPVLSQTVTAVMPARPGARAPGTPHSNSLRELRYEQGRRISEAFIHKEALLLPWHSPRGSGLAYSVSLSAESPAERGVAADERAIIRVKARVSFPLELPASEDPAVTLQWRADLTAVREFSGAEVAGVGAIVTQMFRTAPPMTAATLLRSLGIVTAAGEIVATVATLYRFEVEVEYVGATAATVGATAATVGATAATVGATAVAVGATAAAVGATAAAAPRDMLRAADVQAAAEFVLRLASPERVQEAALQTALYRAAKYVLRSAPGELRQFEREERGLRKLLPQARALTRPEYREQYPPRGYFLTDKADGRRAIGLACDGRGQIAADVLYDDYVPPAPVPPAGDTILDGELVAAADGAMTFWAFDAIVVAGVDLTEQPFEVRVLRIAEGVAALVAAGVPARAKAYAHFASAAPADLERAVRSVYDAPRPYAIDGLILVEPGRSYGMTANYKWKSTEHTTIDFLARRPPAAVLGRGPFVDRPGHRLYFLFVGVSPQMYSSLGMQRCPGYAEMFPGGGSSGYFPIQFGPSDVPLAYLYDHPEGGPPIEGQVVELRCAGGPDGSPCLAAAGGALRVNWELVRIREDRRRDLSGAAYFGNDFRIAEITWLNYVDVFPLEQLWTGPGSDYFQTPRAGVYRAQTAVMNFAKTRLIETLAGAPWVVDVGAGRGSDLGRYFGAGVGHLIAVDNDKAALAELVRRRFDHAKRRPAIGSAAGPRGPGRGTTLYILAADANEPAATLRERLGGLNLPAEGADALVCNLAVHYFVGSTEAMKNFAALARATVRPGGALVLTVLVGELVHKLFQDAGVAPEGAWERLEAPVFGAPAAAAGVPPARKYSLLRHYASKSLEAAGQRVGVLLPFSDGRHYDEYLVNVGALSKVLAARGFGAPARRPVADSVDEFAAQNRPLAAELTAADREWLGLYATLVYRREK